MCESCFVVSDVNIFFYLMTNLRTTIIIETALDAFNLYIFFYKRNKKIHLLSLQTVERSSSEKKTNVSIVL